MAWDKKEMSPEEILSNIRARIQNGYPLAITATVLDSQSGDFERPEKSSRGVLILGKANELKWTMTSGKDKLSVVSDGFNMRVRLGVRDAELATPSTLREDVSVVLTNCGVSGIAFLAITYSNLTAGERGNISSKFTITNAKLAGGASENAYLKFINGHDLREFRTQLWFDPKSFGMLKRISQEVKIGMGHFAEIYDYEPNPVIDTQTFTLGK